MSLRRISDLSPVIIYRQQDKIARTKNMLFEVSYPTTAEANMYTSQALTYEQLSCALLDGIFDWMYGNNGIDLSGNFYFNEYRNSSITSIRKNYQSRLYFSNVYLGGLNAGLKLLNGGVSELLAKSRIDFKIGTTDIDSQRLTTALAASSAPTILTINGSGVSTPNLHADTAGVNALAVNGNANITGSVSIGAGCTVGSGISMSGSTVTATTFNGTAVRANWADLAEYYIADKVYEPGTLVKFGGQYELTEADTEANAVVTTKPGFILNNNLASPDGVPTAIALVGRTPIKVSGKVKKFQNLALSDVPGIACVANGRKVIAKALADKDTDDVGLLECVVKLEF